MLNSPRSRKRTRQRRRRHSSRSPVRRCRGSRRPPARRRSSARVSRWPAVCSRTPDSKRASAPPNPRWTWCSTRSMMSKSWWSWGTGTFENVTAWIKHQPANMYKFAKRRKCSESFLFGISPHRTMHFLDHGQQTSGVVLASVIAPALVHALERVFVDL